MGWGPVKLALMGRDPMQAFRDAAPDDERDLAD
jgi:hypothetical protein